MKKLTYILPLLILAASCANKTGYLKRKSGYESTDSVLHERYDKRIVKQNEKTNSNNQTENDENNNEITEQDLNTISFQKLQQYFEMLNLIRLNPPEDLQEFTQHQAGRFWANPKEAQKFRQKPDLQNIDSFRVISIKPIEFQDDNTRQMSGTYTLKLKSFKNGKEKIHYFKSKILFEIIDLSLDEKIYKTIKTKIITIQ
jgi:hypothetical protein